MAGETPEKIAVYINSMGKTPDQIRIFAGSFSRRFNIPLEKVLGFSKKLPMKIGSYDLQKAKKIGIAIKKMGGEVALKRVKVVKRADIQKGQKGIAPKAAPATPPPRPTSAGQTEEVSWLDTGSALTVEERRGGGIATEGVSEETSWLDRGSALTDNERKEGGVAVAEETDTSWISRHEEPDTEDKGVAPSPPTEEEPSWLTHGSEESQDDLEEFSHTEYKGNEKYQEQFDHTPGEVGTMPDVELNKKRKIGKLESKTTYSTAGASSTEKAAYEKASQLYADKKARSNVLTGPVTKILLLVVIVALGYFGFTQRQYILDYFIAPEKWALEDAYIINIKPDVVVPKDLTGTYRSTTEYKTISGEIHYIDIEIKVEEMEIVSLKLNIAPDQYDLDQYRIYLNFSPGRITYSREVDYDVVYEIDNKSFKSEDESIATINEEGRFKFSIVPMDIEINPANVPDSEKDAIGSAVFLTMEGVYGDTDTFFGGLMSSTLELSGWMAKKKR